MTKSMGFMQGYSDVNLAIFNNTSNTFLN